MRALLNAVVMLVATTANAQQPPPKNVWTKFQTAAPHADVARIACTLGASAFVDGVTRPLSIEALEDGRQQCVAPETVGAIHGRVRMTTDPTHDSREIIVELDVPPYATPTALAALQSVLARMSADIDQRSLASTSFVAPPVMMMQPRPLGPMHPVTVANVPLIAAGAATLGAGYLVSLLVGAAVAGASGDPGTGRFWPFVPFIGAIAFSATYQEAPNCDCEVGRAFSVIGSVVIDAAQIAGAVLTIVGLAVPRTKMVPDAISLRIGPAGAVLEGRF